MFQEYRHRLDSSAGLDLWYDDGISIAENILKEFSADDWDELRQACAVQAPCWKILCAETLNNPQSTEEYALLLMLARDCDGEVVMAALDSLRAFPMTPEVISVRRAWQPSTGNSRPS